MSKVQKGGNNHQLMISGCRYYQPEDRLTVEYSCIYCNYQENKKFYLKDLIPPNESNRKCPNVQNEKSKYPAYQYRGYGGSRKKTKTKKTKENIIK